MTSVRNDDPNVVTVLKNTVGPLLTMKNQFRKPNLEWSAVMRFGTYFPDKPAQHHLNRKDENQAPTEICREFFSRSQKTLSSRE